jgi:hypothetical protein
VLTSELTKREMLHPSKLAETAPKWSLQSLKHHAFESNRSL